MRAARAAANPLGNILSSVSPRLSSY